MRRRRNEEHNGGRRSRDEEERKRMERGGWRKPCSLTDRTQGKALVSGDPRLSGTSTRGASSPLHLRRSPPAENLIDFFSQTYRRMLEGGGAEL